MSKTDILRFTLKVKKMKLFVENYLDLYSDVFQIINQCLIIECFSFK